MKITEIETFAIPLLIFILISNSLQQIIPDACLEFSAAQCTRCRRSTHLYDGLCYENMLGCIQYKEGEFCVRCETGNFLLVDSGCQVVGDAKGSMMKMSLDKYSGQNQSNPGDQYGESNFIPSSYEQVKNWPTFVTLDNFIRKGEYSHYISRMSNPVFSVHYYQQDNIYSYKLLYLGSGGGLFLCIADISATLQVSLRTLTPISASNLIYNCIDYDVNGKCLSCTKGNHLQGSKCYANYGGCLRYSQNLCIQCLDYYLLVENRCVSDCYSVSDARSVLFYEGRQVNSTMEIYYGISITTFYIVKTTIVLPSTNNSIVSSSDEIIMNKKSEGSTSSTMLSQTKMNEYLGLTNSNTNLSDQFKVSGRIFSVNGTSTGKMDQKIMSTSTTRGQYQSSSLTIVQKLPETTTTTKSSLKEDDILSIAQQNNLNLPKQKSSNPVSPLSSQATQNTAVGMTSITVPIKMIDSSNQHCVIFQDKACTKCTQYYFVNQLGICEELSPLCVSVHPSTGLCQKCFNGYVLNKGRCNFKLFS